VNPLVDPADQADVDAEAAPRRPPAGTTAARMLAEAQAAANGNRPPAEASGLLAGLRDGAWLDKQVFPPLAYAVPELIPEGSVLLVGPPKAGKSWLVLAAALAVASGGRALGIEVPQRPVLYLALEDGDRRLQDRCRRLLPPGDPIPTGFQYLTRAEHGRVLNAIAEWLGWEHDAAPLVILDTLGKVMPRALPGENDYQRDYRIGGDLKALADTHPGMTLLVNHHDRKAVSVDFVDKVSGTQGLAGAADTILVLSRDRAETAALLQVTGRDVPEGEYALTFTDGAVWALDGADLGEAAKRARQVRATAGLGDRSAEMILLVEEHPQGVTPSDVAAALGIEQHVARTYLGRLVESGRLRRPRRGLYTPVASVASVALEEDDSPHSNTRNGSNTPLGGAEAAPPLDDADSPGQLYDPDALADPGDPARFRRR